VAHSPGFRSLYGYQPLLSPDVIVVVEMRKLGFIVIGVLLQAIDALFDQNTESGADLESFTSTRTSVFDGHFELPG
jgi:hypothetical protein